MREDWNRRANEDARYFVAFAKRSQSDDEFQLTATEVLAQIREELERLPKDVPVKTRRYLEIGCGVGRLMGPLSHFCGEIHGVDISDEMIRIGRERLASVPHAHLHVAPGSDLRAFADGSFDLVYSYAVMQHLPHEAPFWRYLAESIRVLKPGGILFLQFNSTAERRHQPDTWAGITIPAERVLIECDRANTQVLALEGRGTQYTWLTLTPRLGQMASAPPTSLLATYRIVGPNGEGHLLAGGPQGRAELFCRLPPEYCDLCHLSGDLSGFPLDVIHTGDLQADGLRSVTLRIPTGAPIGNQRLSLRWNGDLLTEPFSVSIDSFIRGAPQLLRVTDGIDLLSIDRIVCGTAKAWINNLSDPTFLRATAGGLNIEDILLHCEDAEAQRYQVNLTLPHALQPGPQNLTITIGDFVVLSSQIEHAPEFKA